jgi:hypothetical protein
MSPTHEDRAIPDLRAMLDLQFERVIISHGEPVHTRDAIFSMFAVGTTRQTGDPLRRRRGID